MISGALLVGAACSVDKDQAAPRAEDPEAATGPALQSTPAREGEAIMGRVPDIVQRVQPSVVTVITDRGEGSGVVYRPGTVVTNHHVVAGARTVRIALASGERIDAKVRATDERSDLAVLDVSPADLPPASFAKSLPRVGSLAIAMGNPLGFENTVTLGIISGLGRSIPGSASETLALIDLVQTDAPISPGNSGGALIDAAGTVVGINVAYIPPQTAGAVSLGFAIPAPTVTAVVDELLRDGNVNHPFLGLQPQPLTPEIARQLNVSTESGVIALDVEDGGPAAAAGVLPGDVIVSVEGRAVRSVEDLLAALRNHRPGERVKVALERDGNKQELTVTLGEQRR